MTLKMDKFRQKIVNKPRWMLIGFIPELTTTLLTTFMKDWLKDKLFIDWKD